MTKVISTKAINNESQGDAMDFETLTVRKEGAVLFAEIAAPPMNLLGPELVRDLVSLMQIAGGEDTVQVLVFKSADPDYSTSHVNPPRIPEYSNEAAPLTRANWLAPDCTTPSAT